MPKLETGTPAYFLIDSIRAAAASVFSQALASAWSVEWSADSDSTEKIAGPCFELSIKGQIHGSAFIRLPKEGALLLSQKFLGEPADSAAELTGDRGEALEELLRQVTGSATTTLRSKFGDVETQLAKSDSCGSEEPAARVTASAAPDSRFCAELYISQELLASASQPSDVPPQASPESPVEESATQPEANLSRLSSVKFRLSLRFGEARLTLGQLMQLDPGAVVELDRRIHQPVDLLLGDKVVAQGDVVVVDGNYGMRITNLPLKLFGIPAAAVLNR